MDKQPKFTFKHLFKRASTWLAIVSSSAMAVITWFYAQPLEVQQNIPSVVITVCSWFALLGTVIGVPLATSYQQKTFKG